MMLLRHRKQLAQTLHTAIDLQCLKERMAEQICDSRELVLVFDFDGVLAFHGEDVPAPDMAEWLQQLLQAQAEPRFFILTNKPSRQRQNYFTRNFPEIHLVSGVRKKPYPDGLLKVAEIAAVHPSEIVLVDDRLLTGALAASIAGTKVSYVTGPLVHFRKRPVQETFFMLLRWIERKIVSALGR